MTSTQSVFAASLLSLASAMSFAQVPAASKAAPAASAAAAVAAPSEAASPPAHGKKHHAVKPSDKSKAAAPAASATR
jgi:hypothetical protein